MSGSISQVWSLLVTAAAITAVGCVLLLRLGDAGRQVEPPRDNPCHRSGRKRVAGLIPVWTALLVSLASVTPTFELVALLASIAGLSIVGHRDDRRPYSASHKLLAQLPFFLVVVLLEPRWAGMGLYPWLIAGLVYSVVVTNAVNVLDVADGLAPAVSGVTLGALGFILLGKGESDLAIVALTFAGAMGGFLLFNASPGSIMLGDAGSLPLGGVTAALVPQALPEDPALALPMAGLLVGAPLFEVAWVSCRRIRRGIPPWVASPHHVAYSLIRCGLSCPQAVGAIVAGHALVVGLALWLAGAAAGIYWAVLLVAVLVTASWTRSRWQSP